MIVVHQSQYDEVHEYQAEKIYAGEKIKKFQGESGITDATTNIRQRFFRKKPKIDHQIVSQVDIAMDQIKIEFTKQDDKGDKNRKKRANQ